MDSLAQFHFLRPLWLLPLPVLLLGYVLIRRRNDHFAVWRRLIAPELLIHLRIPGRGQRHPRLALLLLLILTLLAAAGPAWQHQPPPFAEQRTPLVIGVDLSTSMDASDLPPSRLQRAKLKLHDLLDRRKGARTALLVYAGSAHTLLPLGDDPELLGLYLDSLESALMPRPGKDTRAALAAMDALLANEEQPGNLLLVTDSVEPQAQAALEGRPVVIWAATTTPDALAEAVAVPVIPMHLDSGDLDNLDDELAGHYREQLTQTADSRWQDQGWWLLWPAGALLLLRFRRAVPLLLLLPLLSLPPPAYAGELALWQLWRTPDQQAMRLYERGDYRAASELFSAPQWQGSALYRAGDFEAALSAFNAESTAAAYYNQGNALAMLGHYAQALERYRLALARHPDWQQAQDNLGLLLQLLEQPQEQPRGGEPNLPPDELHVDQQGRRGQAGTLENSSREVQAQIWLNSLEASPGAFLSRKMSIQLQRQEQ